MRILGGALPNEFSDDENVIINSNYAMAVRRMENIFVQVREGLVEEEAVRRFRPSNSFFDTPYFREFWVGWRLEVEPEFRKFFEREFEF